MAPMRSIRLLVTAGPTREMIDPVRFISNLSTGEMGYQIAKAAVRKGWKVTLISGPVLLPAPKKVKFIPVVSTADLAREVKKELAHHDALVMSAAVCDYSAEFKSARKIKTSQRLTLRLKQNEDILKSIRHQKGSKLIIGFCLETENLRSNAKKKLEEKYLDLIVANQVTKRNNPFGRGLTSIIIMDSNGQELRLDRVRKAQVAQKLILIIEQRLV